MKQLPDRSSSNAAPPNTTRAWRKPLHLAIFFAAALIAACAPQAPLPTQAVLPTTAPTQAPVSTATPTDAPDSQDVSIFGSQQSERGQSPEAMEEVTAPQETASDRAVSQRASTAKDPIIRVMGVPQISVAEPAVPNVIVIQASDANLDALQEQVEAMGGTVSRDPSLAVLGTVVITLPETTDSREVARLGSLGQSEPDYYAVALADDPLVSQQWGRDLLRLYNAKVPDNAPLVKVAVIDSGACFTHPDLAGRYLDGWDYVADDADPRDEFGHGCEVSGIIAAVENNGLGIAGVSAQIRILPYRVLDGRGVGRYSNVAAAIVRAVNDGAQVINLSLGGPNTSDVLRDAVAYAQQAGVVVVAAAGNSGLPQVFYPAALDGVISVGAISENHMRSPFSNYGKIDLWAAGENVLTTMRDGTYSRVSGTSFAAPHVAGLAALEIATGRTLIADGRIAVYGGGGDALVTAPEPQPTPDTVITNTKPAMKNPAALECTNLGHEYVITTDGTGSEDGNCLMPDNTTCSQWDFYAGTCGQAFNFCAQQGYQTVSLSDGNDPFSDVYAACADASGQVIGAVSDLSALDVQASACDDGTCEMSSGVPEYSQPGLMIPADDPVSALSVPTSWDWRSYNAQDWLSPVRNQGGCGSCGVFAAIGAIESSLELAAGNADLNLDLAEQYMISTCYAAGSTICGNGSHSHWTLEVAKTTGLCDEGCMPYVAHSTPCTDKCADWSDRLTKIADYGYVQSGLTQTYIKQLIVNRGPVATYLRISNGTYANGYLTCSVDGPIDHAVVLVGYNDAGGYWIMRNSWGASWGDSGYTKVRYGDCGIDSNYIAFSQALPTVPAATNVIRNGGFDNGTDQWQTLGTVDWAVSSGVLAFKRPAGSTDAFGIYQVLNYRFGQNTPVEVSVDLGNSSTVPKTVDITLRNLNSWDGAQTCTMTVPPQSPMRTYTMELLTGEWVNGRFEIGLQQADGLPDVLMDNVRVAQKAGLSAFKCRYPQAEADTELLHNPSFDLGKQGWEAPAELNWSVAGGEATLISKDASTLSIYQDTARRLSANSPVELTFTVKNINTSVPPNDPPHRYLKVTLIDQTDLNWSAPNLVTCFFTLPADQAAFGTYTIRGRLPSDTGNLRLNIELLNTEPTVGIVFSSFVLRYKPGLATASPDCITPTSDPPTSAPLLSIPPSPGTDNTPTIIIGTVPQGETYELEIDDESAFAAPTLYAATLSGEGLTHTTSALADGRLYIRARAVRGVDPNAQFGPWSAVKTLVIDTTPPDVPILSLPVDGAVVKTYTPTLIWQVVSGATAYEVDLGRSNPPNEGLVRVPTTSWLVNRPLLTGLYYWRVRSLDALGNESAWSAVRFFTIETPVGGAPRPNVFTTTTPALTWTPLASVMGYHIQVASDKLFTKVVYSSDTVDASVTSLTIPALANGAYYYRVRGKFTSGWGAWSAITPLVVGS